MKIEQVTDENDFYDVGTWVIVDDDGFTVDTAEDKESIMIRAYDLIAEMLTENDEMLNAAQLNTNFIEKLQESLREIS